MVTRPNVLHCLIIVFLVNCTRAFEYEPKSKEIEVVASDRYTFGITVVAGDPKLVRCHYRTDTGIDDFFEINLKPKIFRSNSSHLREKNKITNSGENGECKLTLADADDTGPTTWTITPVARAGDAENSKETTLPEVVFNVKFFYRAPILVYTIDVLEGASFFNQMKLPRDIALASCDVRFGDEKVALDLHSAKYNPWPMAFVVRDVKKKIMSLGGGLCGFRINNVLRKDANEVHWILSAEDDKGKLYRETFYSRIASVIVQDEKTCNYKIDTFSMQDVGVWRCFSGIDQSLESIEYTVELVEIGFERIEPWVKEEDNYVSIGCRVLNYHKGALYTCKLIAPNRRTYNVRYGSATDRYITIGTEFNDAICSLQIKKPLLDDEKGFWKCHVVGPTNSNLDGGAFIYVGKTEIPDYPKNLKITTELDKSFNIICEVPYSSTYCRIKAPNGTQYESTKPTHVTLGRCLLEVKKVVASDSGTWTCSFARRTGLPDDEIKVDVIVAEVLSYYNKVEVDTGSSAQLMCNTGDMALLYCRYISPTGSSFHIENRQSSTGISYYGKGLEYGECGITISNVQLVDAGYWTCVTRLVTNEANPEISAQILLTVTEAEDSSNAAQIGIGVAVSIVLISIVFGIVVINKRRRRRRPIEHNEQQTGRPRNLTDRDNVSDTSDVVFDMNTIQNST